MAKNWVLVNIANKKIIKNQNRRIFPVQYIEALKRLVKESKNELTVSFFQR